MVHTAQHSVSMCVSQALSFFSGFPVEQTLLKYTGPHAYTNTINSGACLLLHLFPDQKNHTHTRSHAHAPVHTQTAFLWEMKMLKNLWVLFIAEESLSECFETNGQRHHSSVWFTVWKTLHLHCDSTDRPVTRVLENTFLHGLAGVFTSSLTHLLHIMWWILRFSNLTHWTPQTHLFQTEPSLPHSDKIRRWTLTNMVY